MDTTRLFCLPFVFHLVSVFPERQINHEIHADGIIFTMSTNIKYGGLSSERSMFLEFQVLLLGLYKPLYFSSLMLPSFSV